VQRFWLGDGVMRWFLQCWYWLWARPDPVIDGLIAERGVIQYRPGMTTYDPRPLQRWGRRTWHAVESAQRRGLKAVK
jgi:hypothetical protein